MANPQADASWSVSNVGGFVDKIILNTNPPYRIIYPPPKIPGVDTCPARFHYYSVNPLGYGFTPTRRDKNRKDHYPYPYQNASKYRVH